MAWYDKYSSNNENVDNSGNAWWNKYGTYESIKSFNDQQVKEIQARAVQQIQPVEPPKPTTGQKIKSVAYNIGTGIKNFFVGKPNDPEDLSFVGESQMNEINKLSHDVFNDSAKLKQEIINYYKDVISPDSELRPLVARFNIENFDEIYPQLQLKNYGKMLKQYEKTGETEVGMGIFKRKQDITKYDRAKEKEFEIRLKTIEDAKEAIQEVTGEKQADKGFLGGVLEGLKNLKYDFSPSANYYKDDIDIARREALEKLQNNEPVSDKDWAYINSYRAEAFNRLVEVGLGDKASDVLVGTINFGGEMYLTKVLAGDVSSSATPLIKAIPSEKAQKIISKIMKNSVQMAVQSQYAVPLIDAKTAQYMLPTVEYEKWLSEGGETDILDYLKKGDDATTAEFKARVTTMIEYLSEGVGNYIDDAMPFVKKAFIGKFLRNRGIDSTSVQVVKQTLKNFNINGIVGEVIEEEVGEPFLAFIEKRDYKDPFTTPEGRERLLVSVLGIGALQGMARVSDATIDGVNNFRSKHRNKITIPVDDGSGGDGGGGASGGQPKRENITKEIDQTQYEGVEQLSVNIKPDAEGNRVGDMFVVFNEDAQKQGQGSKLVSEIEQKFVEKGVSQVNINSYDSAVGFWEKMGYKIAGEVKKGLVPMTKTLDKGITSQEIKKDSTEGIVEPKITKVKKGVATTKTKATAQKTQKMVGKSEISSKNAKSEPMTVTDHEKSIRDVYKKNEEKVYNALGEIFAEMEVAEAGQRIFVEQPDSSESKVIGISSTFPKWIPEDLRSKKLFDAVLGKIATIEDLTYPTGNRTAQRALFDEILSEVDRRSGLDTVKDRNAIIDLYDKGIKQTTKTANKRLEGRKGTPKVSEEKPQTKEKQVKETPKSEPKKKQVSDADIIKYVKKRSTKFRSSGTVENLVEDAKNYDSAEEFIKAHQSQYIYHGASKDLGDAPTLKRGYGYGDPVKYTGQDMGGIFFTPTLKYAMQYSQEGENSLYRYKLPKDIKIFDIRDPKHRAEFVVNSKNWEDYDNKENAKSDALRMLEDMKESSFAGAVDWATASQYIENLRQSGFDGARFLERRGDIGIKDDGSFTITGDPIYSYAIFSIDEIPVERALSKQQLVDIYNKAKQYDKQDRELLTFHNIRSEGIMKANKMGGIPVPSLAITKASVPFEGYGEVTLVGGDKFALDDVFTSDAYTRRVPKQQYEINRQEQSRLLKDIEPYQKLTGEEKYRGMYTALSDEANPQDLVRRANDSNVAKAMFLKEELGMEIPEAYKEKNISKDIANAQFGLGTRALADSEKFVKIIRSGDANKIESVEREDKLENPEKWNRVTMFYREMIEDAYKGALNKLSGTDYAQQVADEYRARLEETFFSDGELIAPATYNVSYRVQEYLKNGTQEVDTDKMSEKINKAFEKVDQKTFDNWVIRRFGGIFGRSYFYDNAGRKKLYSLENIMEYMTGRVRGQENFFYGAGSIKSKISKKLFGADEIRANKDLILPDAQTKEIHDSMQDELGQLIEEIKAQSEWKNTDSFGLYDQIGKDIASVGTTITPGKVKSALRKAGVSDPSTELVEKTQDYLKRLQTAPVGYFETKPQRVVKLNEFAGALVPNDIDPEVREILEKQGLKVVEYDPKVENDRSIKAQLNFKGEMFRVKDDVKKITGRTITDEQEKQLIDLNKRIFGDDNVKITLQIMANRRALGSHREGMIQIVDGQANPKDTYYHEAVHKYIDVFTTQSEQISLFKEGMKKYGTEDLSQVEEQLAEDFIEYAKKREGVTGKIRSIFTSVLNRIRKYLNSYSAIDEMYEQILTPVNQKLARKAVSKENVPVGKGEVKDSALVKRMSEQLLMSDPTKYEFDDTTGKYNQLNLEEDAKKAVSFLEKNPEKAIAVSMGIVDAPAGQTANGIGIATALKARDEGNYRLYSDIINAVSLRATRMGQEIVSLRGQFNDDSAENYVKRVIDARMGKLSDDLVTAIGAVMKKTSPKKKTMERVQKETVKLKETLSKEQKKVRLAQDIIDAMRC